jgi:hypothetical protein
MLTEIGNFIFQMASFVAALGAIFGLFLLVLPPGHEVIAGVILPFAVLLVGWAIKRALEALDRRWQRGA